MQSTTKKIIADFKTINFEPDDLFKWSPKDRTVYYESANRHSQTWLWSLVHEVGHASLDHAIYRDDLELLIMEVAAWKKAKEIAARYDITIDQQHIDSCIDTYRDWLHGRSRCVECKAHAFQADLTTYQCHNCSTRWKVPTSRLCHITRRRIKTA